jgi:hypothetical protein
MYPKSETLPRNWQITGRSHRHESDLHIAANGDSVRGVPAVFSEYLEPYAAWYREVASALEIAFAQVLASTNNSTPVRVTLAPSECTIACGLIELGRMSGQPGWYVEFSDWVQSDDTATQKYACDYLMTAFSVAAVLDSKLA